MPNKILPLLFAVVLLSGFSRQAKKKIIFFGDSITEQGAKPGGYIRLLDSMLIQKGLDKNYELLGAGIGGNKVYDLYLRMEDDVLAKNPDAVVIWIGVNDVWHKRSLGTGTDADKFEKFYAAILKKLQDRKIRVFICTPAVVGEKNDATNELDGDLNKYSVIIRGLAQKNNCPLIDLRQLFGVYLQANNPGNKDRGILTTDGVHLNATGNAFVAQHMMEVLGREYVR
jgi:lysophospholipase L1-like esterase